MPRRVREFGLLSAANQFAMVGSIAAMAILARVVGVDDFGRVVFAQACAAIAMMILDVRFDDAVQRYFPILNRTNGFEAAANLYVRMLRWDALLGLGVVVCALGLYFVGGIPNSGAANAQYLLVAMVSAGLGTSVGTLNAAYAVRDELNVMATKMMASSITNTVFSIAGALMFGGLGFLVGVVIGTWVQVVLLYWPLRGIINQGRLAPVTKLPRGIFKFMWKSSLAGSVSLGTESGVVALGGILVGPGFSGLLKVAVAPSRAVAALVSPISVQAFPSMSRLASVGDFPGIAAMARRLAFALLPFAAVILSLAVLFMDETIVLVYGEEFVPAALPAIVLVAGSLARACVAWSKVLPLAVGRPGLRLAVLAGESFALLLGLGVVAWLTSGSRGLIHFSIISTSISVLTSWFWWMYASRLARSVDLEV